MTHNQLLILLILATTLGLFLWGYWRHDMVAVGALLACVVAGVLPKAEAFAGFSHPAVITVACVLVLSRALQRSGAIDVLAQRVLPAAAGPRVTIAALTGLGAVLSAFMNNVGALALLLPVAVQGAEKQALPSGTVLMPLAAGTILGGMTTLIGTPPNLIVSGFRAHTEAGSFAMFDFTPVGLAVAATGVLFVGLVGWRLVPARQQAGVGGFDIGGYLTEARVTKGSKAVGRTIREVEQSMDDSDAQIVGVVHNEFRVAAPNPGQTLQVGDLLVIEAEPKSLASALAKLGFKLEEDVGERPAEPGDDRAIPPAAKRRSGDRPSEQGQETGEKTKAGAEEFALIELAVRPDAALIGRSATDLHLRTRHGINLLALSRQGRRSVRRLRSQAIKAGDVLLMQGLPETVMEFASEFGCVPLARRSIRIPNRRRAVLATGILAAAIAGAAFGLLPAALSFAAGVLACMALRVMPLRAVYEAVDWPVIVLLAALLPVAGVMDSTGAADLLARCLLENVAQGNAILGLLIVLVLTMTLSDFMNNAATAAVMCPIAISTATELGVSPDSFLMAVAIGASCAFLTPIGHQNNTLILGPGGFRFGDYWKLGLPLELLVVAVSVPLLLVFWPLR